MMRKLTWHSEYNLSLSAFRILPHREGLDVSQLSVWQLQQVICIDSCKIICCKQPHGSLGVLMRLTVFNLLTFPASLLRCFHSSLFPSHFLVFIGLTSRLALRALFKPSSSIWKSSDFDCCYLLCCFCSIFCIFVVVTVRWFALTAAKGIMYADMECQRQRQKSAIVLFC